MLRIFCSLAILCAASVAQADPKETYKGTITGFQIENAYGTWKGSDFSVHATGRQSTAMAAGIHQTALNQSAWNELSAQAHAERALVPKVVVQHHYIPVAPVYYRPRYGYYYGPVYPW